MADDETTPAVKPDDAKQAEPVKQGRLAKLVQKNPQLVASIVVGVAGLIATSIWQYRQQQTQKTQADAAQRVVEIQAANSWKIERTEILGKNLQTLALTGPETADQRYGVLLSLVRAEILDPELAVSYSLELGRDNADYMVSVLQSTPNKSYDRLLHAYSMSCDERFGVSPAIDECVDKLGARSTALAKLVSEDVATQLATDQPAGPFALLKDERHVQASLARLTGFFTTTLLDMYDRRAWDDLAKFASYSPGAHLVMSIVLAAAREHALATEDEAKTFDDFHAAQTKFLVDYLGSKACDATCKSKMVDVMLTRYAESAGDYDAAMRKLVEGAPTQSQPAIGRLHDRLLYCQVADDDLVALRDHVLVPAAVDVLKPTGDAKLRAAVLELLAVAQEPAGSDPDGAAAYAALLAQIDKDPAIGKWFRERRTAASRQRLTTPRGARHATFCNAPAAGSAPAPAPAPAK